MRNRKRLLIPALATAGILGLWAQQQKKKKGPPPDRNAPNTGYTDTMLIPGQKWRVHDKERPRPPLVTPFAQKGNAPSDAIVLFDGTDLSKWTIAGRRAAEGKTWKVENGYMEVVGGAGTLATKEKFGDIQLHVEWASPANAAGASQWRGNSGILLMSRYEIQVLDSWDNPTYADGQAAAVYAQYPPMVNASLKPGEWQYYDIIFEAPKFEGEKLVKNAYVTVFHNGVLMHHRRKILGPMAHRIWVDYKAHEAEAPLALQDHDVPVRYRNIWVRRWQSEPSE